MHETSPGLTNEVKLLGNMRLLALNRQMHGLQHGACLMALGTLDDLPEPEISFAWSAADLEEGQ